MSNGLYRCPHCGSENRYEGARRLRYCASCKKWKDELAEYSAFMGYRVGPLEIFSIKRELAAKLGRERAS